MQEPLNTFHHTQNSADSIVSQLAFTSPFAHLGRFDELRGQESQLGNTPTLARHWNDFFKFIGPNGVLDFNLRQEIIAKQVRDNGVTYNVYANPDGSQRPWSLDLFPVIITNEDWKEIEKGALQRASLLEKIMVDIYGSQSFIHRGFIPPALVHGHPGYIRSLKGVIPQGGKHLHIIALDLAKGPDGHWSVLSQRTQAPSGLGYLLENRSIISQQFPTAFSSMNIESTTQSYRELIETLKFLSPAKNDAHVAILTPGPYNETYFEHAYLAKYLGITLVEGNDLTIRDQKVYLRTIRGLEQVDVLIKRLDDDYLDPLELKADSTLGIPGLLEAIRAGNIIMANAPGSAILESPALLGFLPALSEAILGEKLLLPGMNTWWCGEQAAMEAALPQLSKGVVKSTYPTSHFHESYSAALGNFLSPQQLNEWVGKIISAPDLHTVQRYIPLAQTPTWQGNSKANQSSGIIPRSYMLRVFALSSGPQSWYILPGGMARIANFESDISSMQLGGSSADVWVQKNAHLYLPPTSNLSFSASETGPRKKLITSRAAENLYWFGRYSERAENTIRLARLGLDSLNNDQFTSPQFWNWLEELSAQNGLIPNGVPSKVPGQGTLSLATFGNSNSRHRIFERTLITSLNKDHHTNSVGFNLISMKLAASKVRERLSNDQWRTIEKCVQQFEDDCNQTNSYINYSTTFALDALNKASNTMAAVVGSQLDRMTRDDGWQLLSIGRNIERLMFLSSTLSQSIESGVLDHTEEDESGFFGLLSLFDSKITFQSQYQQSRELSALIELLVLDKENPRSLSRVARSISSRLSKLAHLPFDQKDLITQTIPDYNQFNLLQLVSHDSNWQLTNLKNCLDQFFNVGATISNTLNAKYFSHTLQADYITHT